MGVAWLVIQLGFIFALTVILLNKYGSWRKQHAIVNASTLVGWYFSFIIVLILPLDIAITFYEKCLLDETRLNSNINNTITISTDSVNYSSLRNATIAPSVICIEPKGYVPIDVLLELWRVVYWTTQFLTWIILPLLQSYAKAGEFTTMGRLREAVRANVLYYVSYALIFFLLLIYAVSRGVSLSFEHLKVLVVSASNTWGLFLLVLLLGYGFVEVPRQLWLMGSRDYRLQRAYFDINTLSMDKNDAEETIRELYREAREVLNVLKSTRGDAREKAQQILGKFPAEVARAAKNDAPRFANAAPSVIDADAAILASDTYLIRLNRRVIDAVQNHHRCQAQWAALLSRAFYLEDVDAAAAAQQLPAKWTRMSRVESPLTSQLAQRIPPLLRFHWHVTIQRPIFQALGVVCALLSALIVWSECTFFVVHPQLSAAARALHSAAIGAHYRSLQWGAVALLFYLNVCAYYTIFRLRIYRYYRLDPHQMTDENSLIFSAMLLCRLTPPMCLNFLGMIHMDSHVTSGAKFGVETQFTRLMGHLDVIPLVAKGINIYLPILILLLCLGTWFKVGIRLLHSLGIDQFIDDADQITAEMVANGRALVQLERNRINREKGRENRNRVWSKSFGSVTGGIRPGARDPSAKYAKSKGNFDRIDYEDCEPIIEHQDNEGLFLTDSIGVAQINEELENYAKVPPPSSDDLAFGSAFDASPVAATTLQATLRNDAHPAPSSIFDDL